MTTHDPDFLAPKRVERLAFDRYVLDLERGCLFLNENELALRPKTFAVLNYLVRNCARLISKDELFAAVWPNVAVTDDALVQSIGELRRALGDDGPRLIKTVPRRGYRLECTVSPFAPTAQSATETLPGSTVSLDEPRPLNTVIPLRTPTGHFETIHAGTRIGWTALITFIVLLAAGMLSSGILAAWKFPGVLGHGRQNASQNPEINTKPAVAILPFLNQSGEASRDYFTDGLTQDIINAVGRFSELTVMSWNAVLPYKGRPASPAEIAHNLAVRYQVEGSIRQTDDRVRVSAQLVDMDGKVLWSARFDEAFADVFALQDKITTQVAGALAIRVTEVEQRRAFARPTENLEAYDYVLRSRPALQRPARANNVEARAFLRHAIQLDPGYAAAYAALAETYHIAVSMGWAESPTEYLSRAEEMANKALSFDDSEVRAHIVLGRIHIFYHRYEQAMAEMGRALAINPNDATGLAGRGNCLMWMGQTDAAIEVLEAAHRVDPEMNAIDRFALSLAYYLKRRYVEAIEQAELNLRGTAGANFSRDVLAASYAQNNQTEEATRIVAIIRRMEPAFDPREFGSKFLNRDDLEHLQDGFRKAGLFSIDTSLPSAANGR